MCGRFLRTTRPYVPYVPYSPLYLAVCSCRLSMQFLSFPLTLSSYSLLYYNHLEENQHSRIRQVRSSFSQVVSLFSHNDIINLLSLFLDFIFGSSLTITLYAYTAQKSKETRRDTSLKLKSNASHVLHPLHP